MADITYNTQIKLDDPTSFATTLAKHRAAELMAPATAVVNGMSITQYPPPRPTDVADKAAGKTPTAPPPTEGRAEMASQRASMAHSGFIDGGDEAGMSARSAGMPLNQISQVFGPGRDFTNPTIPSMEALLGKVANDSLGKVLSLLPPAFSSLLPTGSLPGATFASGLLPPLPVSLNGLTQLIGGAALGAVAGQAVRSISGGVSGISGMTGLIGAQAISRSTSGLSGIPVNIVTTFGNSVASGIAGNFAGSVASGLGANPQASAVIANVVGTVANVALKQRSGIPVGPQVLGLAANVALRATGVPVSVSTGVLGVATNLALSSVSSLLGGSIGSRVPILPSNLSSLANLGALSGITQGLNPNIIQSVIPSSNLQGLLPGNIQNQIPGIPNNVTNPYSANAAPNDITTRRQTNPETAPQQDLAPNAPPPDSKAPALTETIPNSGPIPYKSMISRHLRLGDVTCWATSQHQNLVPGPGGRSCDMIAKELSWIATNILDILIDQHPGHEITSGYRGPGGSNYPNSDHCYGNAVDIKWRPKDRRFHYEVCKSVRTQNLPVSQCIFEIPNSTMWCHMAGGPNVRNPSKRDNTWRGGAYLPGLIYYA